MNEGTPDILVAEILGLSDWIDVQTQKFNEHLKPHKEKLEALKLTLQELLLVTNLKSIRTDAGTAYLSTIVTPSIEGDKTEFLDWCLSEWDTRGAMLQIGAPQKTALQEYMDAHQGQLPPHVKTSSFTRVNVRRS